jgi:hypothetical protein
VRFCRWKGEYRQRKLRTLQQDWGRGLRSIRDMKSVLKMRGEVAIKGSRDLFIKR